MHVWIQVASSPPQEQPSEPGGAIRGTFLDGSLFVYEPFFLSVYESSS